MMPDLSLAIASYKDAPHLERNVLSIKNILDNTKYSVEWIFVEDCGNDGAEEIIERIVKSNNFEIEPKLIFHKNNTGRGKAIQDAFEIASGKVLGYLDIDLAVSPAYIPLFLHKILTDKFDIVTALRVYRVNFHPECMLRDMLSYFYRLLSKSYMRIPYLDTETGYKFFRRECILDIMKYAKNPKWFWDTEVMYYAHILKYKAIELPCLYLRDKNKESTVRIIHDSIDYLKNLHKLKQNRKINV